MQQIKRPFRHRYLWRQGLVSALGAVANGCFLGRSRSPSGYRDEDQIFERGFVRETRSVALRGDDQAGAAAEQRLFSGLQQLLSQSKSSRMAQELPTAWRKTTGLV
jgi:hypothetical protein